MEWFPARRGEMFESYFSLFGAQGGGDICPRLAVSGMDPCQWQAAFTRLADHLASSCHPLRMFAVPDGEQTITVLKDVFSRGQVPFFTVFHGRHLDHLFCFSKQNPEFLFRIGGFEILQIFSFRERQGYPQNCAGDQKNLFCENSVRPFCQRRDHPKSAIQE
jgi:hypothetical protein